MQNSYPWRCAIVTDTHLGSTHRQAVHNIGLGDEMPAALRGLGAEVERAGARFVLHCGDVIDAGTPEQIAAAADLLGTLPCPLLLALGNHDSMGQDRRPDWIRALPDVFREGTCHYTRVIGGLRFLVLHPWWRDAQGEPRPWWEGRDCRWALPAEQLAWLDATLAADLDTPAVVVHHAQLIPLAARRLVPGAPDHTPPDRAADPVLEVLRAHPQVRCVISGHTHAQQIERAAGLVHLGNAALLEFPCTYRLVTVYPDRMAVTTHALPGLDAGRSRREGWEWTAGQEEDTRGEWGWEVRSEK